MKKLLSLVAVFITTILLFNSCKKETNEEFILPGNWKTDLQYINETINCISCGGTIDCRGDGIVIYRNSTPTQPDSNKPIQKNGFRTDTFLFAYDSNLTGFEATAKSTSPYCTYGFSFNRLDDDNMYEINFNNAYFKIWKQINGEWTTYLDWTENKNIKIEPAENTIAVYTDGKDIVIRVNGVNISTIRDPELTIGKIGFITGVGYDDIANGTGYTVTYQLKQAQYQ